MGFFKTFFKAIVMEAFFKKNFFLLKNNTRSVVEGHIRDSNQTWTNSKKNFLGEPKTTPIFRLPQCLIPI